MPFGGQRLFFCHRHTNRANKASAFREIEVFKELQINSKSVNENIHFLYTDHLADFIKKWVFDFTETHAPCEMVSIH